MIDRPDNNVSVLLQGVNDTGDIKTIKVDDTGGLYALLKAVYGTTPKALQCDSDGVLKLNISAQSLSYTSGRKISGAPIMSSSAGVVVANNTTLLSGFTGKGIIYGGLIYGQASSSIKYDYITLFIDGIEVLSAQWAVFNLFGVINKGDYIAHLLAYDDANFSYCLSLDWGLTYEQSFQVYYTETYGNTPTISTNIVYGLMT